MAMFRLFSPCGGYTNYNILYVGIYKFTFTFTYYSILYVNTQNIHKAPVEYFIFYKLSE